MEVTALIDEITSLKLYLTEVGCVESMEIPKPTEPIEVISLVKAYLQSKANSYRIECYMNQFIILFGDNVEKYFDGTREILGRKPNLRGFSAGLLARASYMKRDAVELYNTWFKEQNINPAFRIGLDIFLTVINCIGDGESREVSGGRHSATILDLHKDTH